MQGRCVEMFTVDELILYVLLTEIGLGPWAHNYLLGPEVVKLGR